MQTDELANKHGVSAETVQQICKSLGYSVNGSVPEEASVDFSIYCEMTGNGVKPTEAIAKIVKSRNPEPQPEESQDTAPKTKNGKKPTALEKRQKGQEQNKSALVTNKQRSVLASAKVKQTEGRQQARQDARVMVEAYLDETANCYDAFTASVLQSGQALNQITDEAYADFDLEGEDVNFSSLEGEELAALPGGFSL